MVKNPDKHVQSMQNLCEKKYTLLKDILELTKKQTQLVSKQDFEELNKIIDIKQERIDEINRLDEDFSHELQELKAAFGVERLDDLDKARAEGMKGLKELKSTIKDIMDLTGQIGAIEGENNKMVSAAFKEMSEKLKKINTAREVRKAYSKQQDMDPVYFDKKIGK